MSVVTEYAEGVPCWVDLATPDVTAAQRFYGELFGWSFGDPDDETQYVMATLDGHSVAGIMRLSEEMAQSGMPTVWTTYVKVDDAAATAAKVSSAGGTVVQPAMDVMDFGRMAVLTDPTGAALAIWQPKSHLGAGLVNQHGTLTWNELMTPDPGAAAAFYASVFGWRSETVPMGGEHGDYTVFRVDGGSEDGIAGAMAPPMEGMPPFWGVYFHVDDTDAAFEQATSLGARPLAEPTDIPGVGRFAAMTDPLGAMFSVMTGG